MDYHDVDDLELLSMSNSDTYPVRNQLQIETLRQSRLVGLVDKTRKVIRSFVDLIVSDSTRYILTDYGFSSDSDSSEYDPDSTSDTDCDDDTHPENDSCVDDKERNSECPSRSSLFRKAVAQIRDLRNMCAEGMEHQNAIWFALVDSSLLKSSVNALSRLTLRCDKIETEDGLASLKASVEYSLLLTYVQLLFNLTAGNDLNRTHLFHTTVAPFVSVPKKESFPLSIPYTELKLPSSDDMPDFNSVYRIWRYLLSTKVEALRECATGILHNSVIFDSSKADRSQSAQIRVGKQVHLWDCYQWGTGTDAVTQIEVRFIPYRIHSLFTYPSCPSFEMVREPSSFLFQYDEQAMPFSWLAFWLLFPKLASISRSALGCVLTSPADGGVGLSPELLICALSTTLIQSNDGASNCRNYDQKYGEENCFVGMMPDALWPTRMTREKLEKFSEEQIFVDEQDRDTLRKEATKDSSKNNEDANRKIIHNADLPNRTCFAFSERERLERLKVEVKTDTEEKGENKPSASAFDYKTSKYECTKGHKESEDDEDDEVDCNEEKSDLHALNGDPKFNNLDNSIWRSSLLRFAILCVPHLSQVLISSSLRALAVLVRSLRGASFGLPEEVAEDISGIHYTKEQTCIREGLKSGIVLPSEFEFQMMMGKSIDWSSDECNMAATQARKIQVIVSNAEGERSLASEYDAWHPANAWAYDYAGDSVNALSVLTRKFALSFLDSLSQIADCLDVASTELLEFAQQDSSRSIWTKYDKNNIEDTTRLVFGFAFGVRSTVASLCKNLGAWLTNTGSLAEGCAGLPNIKLSPLILDDSVLAKSAKAEDELPTVGSTSPLFQKTFESDTIYPKLRSDLAPSSLEANNLHDEKSLNATKLYSRASLAELCESPHTFSSSVLFLLHPAIHAFATITSTLVDENLAVSSSEHVLDEEDVKAFALGPSMKSTFLTRGNLLWQLFFPKQNLEPVTGTVGVSSGVLLHAALALQLAYPRVFRVAPPQQHKEDINNSKESLGKYASEMPSRVEAVALASIVRSLILADSLDVPVHAGDGLKEIQEEAKAEIVGPVNRDLDSHTNGIGLKKKLAQPNVTPESFKCDVIRVIGHLAYVCGGALQSLLGEWGALEVVLNHCYFDRHNPYIREWSVLSVRHLAHEHYGNQTRIANLTLQGVQQSKTLENMGLKAWMDPETGKIRVASESVKSSTEAEKEEEKIDIPFVNSVTGDTIRLGERNESELAGPNPENIIDIDTDRLKELEHNSINAKF